MPTLYIIDGYAQFFRAYHAIRTPMTSPVTKEPTNMTFGFVGMLLKLLRGQGKLDGPPDYVMVALDVSGDRGTFRSQLHPEYKAHRPPPPEDLFPQVERCIATLRELGVPVIGAEGFEADDVIATLVAKLRETRPDLRIRIVSKDKDLKQLLAPSSVEMFDIHNDAPFTVESLAAESGITPAQVIDMLTLMGDTVDNVPGVVGVGPKTAAELIVQYGSLDNVLAHAAEIKGKRGENIRAAAHRLGLSKTLITLRADTPLPPEALDLSKAEARAFTLEKLGPILKELGFNRYQEELRALLATRGSAEHGVAQSGQTVARPAAADAGGLFGGAEPDPEAARTVSGPKFMGGLFDSIDAGADGAAGTTADANPNHRCVKTKKELDEVVAKLRGAELFAIDTETTSLSPIDAELCGISLSVEAGSAWYIPIRSPDPSLHLSEKQVLDALRPILEDDSKARCGHNLKYDLLVLRRAGVRLRGLGTAGSCDSMVASYLIDSSRSSHSLDALSLALLGRGKGSISELIGSGKEQRSFVTVPIDAATHYAALDADLSLQLAQKMLPQLRAMGMMDLFQKLEMPLVEVLAELEWNGIRVDPDELDRQRERLAGRITKLIDEIHVASMESIGRTFEPDSPKQLGAALFNKKDAAEPGLGLTSLKKTKTGHSTDAEVLEKLASDPAIVTPLPRLILEYRQLTKLVSTYLVALKDAINPRTGRVHTSFSQTGAATGRLASSDPNLQNIPIRTEIGREIRKAFVAPPGRLLVTADYSQIELRLLAHLSKDPGLTEAFHKGEDIHTQVAAQIAGVTTDKVTREQRAGAKMVNFGIVYGVTPFGLARRLKISNEEAAAIIDGYKRRFSGITTFLQECIEQARRFGYVETMMKRRRPITDIESSNPSMRALAERVAINSVVQGSAADLIKLAMVDIQKMIESANPTSPDREGGVARAVGGPESTGVSGAHGPLAHARGSSMHNALPLRDVKMLLQIHDELVFEAPEAGAEAALQVIVERMESAMTLSVPLKVDGHAGKNWFEGK